MLGSFRLDPWEEGPVGRGQGGLAAYRFCRLVGTELNVRLHAAIPLGTDLAVHRQADGTFTATNTGTDSATNSNTGAGPGELILSGTKTPPASAAHPTPTVTAAEGRAGHAATHLYHGHHSAPNCISCGLGDKTMGVHPGPLDPTPTDSPRPRDLRWAVEFTPPDWALTPDGTVAAWVFWMAMDCTAGFAVQPPDDGLALTAQYQVTTLIDEADLHPGAYLVVAEPVEPAWDGRKRRAVSAAYRSDGTPVARADSFWISA